MTSATLRLAFVSLSSGFLLFISLFTLRQCGLQQQHAAPHHPWLEQTQWIVQTLRKNAPCTNLHSPPASGEGAMGIWRISVRAQDQTWIIDCQSDKRDLESVLAATNGVPIWLRVEAIQPHGLEQLKRALTNSPNPQRFAIEADSQSVARSLRKMAPQWLYVADASQLLRLHLFSSLWIEPIMDFWPDIVMVRTDGDELYRISDREEGELIRRKKRIVWPSRNSLDTMTTRSE